MLLLPIIGSTQLTNVIKVKIESSSLSDETVVRFLNGATAGFDSNFDAYKFYSLNPNSPSLYTSITSNENLSINALPQNALADTIATLNALIPASDNYNITLTELGAFDDTIKITIHGPNGSFEYSGDTTFAVVLNAHIDTLNPLQVLQIQFEKNTNESSINVVNTTCPHSNDGELQIDGVTQGEEVLVRDESNTIIHHTAAYTQPITISSLTAGTYSVTIGNHQVESAQINIETDVSSEFDVSDTILLESDPIVYTSSSTQGSIEYAWGDGTSSNCNNCSHEYTSVGTYTITQTVSLGNCSESSSITVEVVEDNNLNVSELTSNNSISIRDGVIQSSSNDELLVFDLSGKLVKRGFKRVPTNDMRGIFIVHAISSNHSEILKISLQ